MEDYATKIDNFQSSVGRHSCNMRIGLLIPNTAQLPKNGDS